MHDNEASPTFVPPTKGQTPSRLRGLGRAAFTGRSGTARIGVLVAAAAVAAGLSIGHGFSATSAKSGYDLAWLADGHRGQVIQVDPVLGQTNVRLQVAKAGDDLDIQQGNGQLIVVDHSTGKITSIDLGTLLVGGNRAETSASDIKVLLAGPRMYVANLAQGTVQAVDPSTEANIGTPWSAHGPLVDVGIDGQHHVWALGQDEQLTSLVWEASTATLKPSSHHTVTGTGSGSVIVGHKRGVTVVGAQGTIARVGTDHDSTLVSKQTHGPLSAPQSSPDGIVPVADPANSSIVIVGPGGAVVDRIDSLGCSQPGSPLVFEGRVYVPCLGAGQVVVLDQDGNAVANPIRTPGGSDPQLTVSDGHLLVSAPGAGSATVVDGSGQTHTFPTIDPRSPVQNPTQTPPPPPSPPPATPSNHQNDHSHGGRDNGPVSGGGNGGGNHPGAAGADPSQGSQPPAGPPDTGSAQATATARADGTVLVSWSGPVADGGYEVRYGSNPVADVPSGATSAVVTVLDPGTTTAFTVHGLHHGQDVWTATTNTITVAGSVVVSDLAYVATSTGGQSFRLGVSWTSTGAGAGVTYSVATSVTSPHHSTSTNVPDTTTAATSTDIPISCGATRCSGTISVTPVSGAGDGSTVSTPFTVGSAQTPPTTAPTTPATPVTPPQQTTAAPAPAPPTTVAAPAPPVQAPLPTAGEQLVTTSATPGSDATGNPGTITVTVNAPSDWASWSGGSCAILVDGVADVSVPCSANGVVQSYDFYESGLHTFAVRATATDQRTSDSATVNQSVIYRPDTGCTPNCCQQRFVGVPSQVYCGCNVGTGVCPAPPFVGTSPADAAKSARPVTGSVKPVRLPVITAAAYRAPRNDHGWLAAAAISLGGLVLLGAGGIGAVMRRRRWSQ